MNRQTNKKGRKLINLREGSPVNWRFTISQKPNDIGHTLLIRFVLKIKERLKLLNACYEI